MYSINAPEISGTSRFTLAHLARHRILHLRQPSSMNTLGDYPRQCRCHSPLSGLVPIMSIIGTNIGSESGCDDGPGNDRIRCRNLGRQSGVGAVGRRGTRAAATSPKIIASANGCTDHPRPPGTGCGCRPTARYRRSTRYLRTPEVSALASAKALDRPGWAVLKVCKASSGLSPKSLRHLRHGETCVSTPREASNSMALANRGHRSRKHSGQHACVMS